MSLNRAPAPPTDATRGNAAYIPFLPGSFPNPILNLPKEDFTDTGKYIYFNCLLVVI